MVQTAHPAEMPIARAGQRADLSQRTSPFSRLAEDAGGAGAGLFVVEGTDKEAQAIAPTTTGEVTGLGALGVVMYDASKEPARTAAAILLGNEYDIEQALPLANSGRVWVLCDDAATIVANTAAFVRFVAGVGEKLGAFREDADTADAVALPNAVFRSAHKDVDFQGGFTQRIALLEINLP